MVLRMRRKHRRRRDTQQAHHTTHSGQQYHKITRWDDLQRTFHGKYLKHDPRPRRQHLMKRRRYHWDLSTQSRRGRHNGRQQCSNNLLNSGWFNHNLCKQDKMWTIKPYPDIEVGVLKEKIGKWESHSICRIQVLSFDEKEVGWFNKWQIFWNIWQKIFQVFFTPLQRVVAERV